MILLYGFVWLFVMVLGLVWLLGGDDTRFTVN